MPDGAIMTDRCPHAWCSAVGWEFPQGPGTCPCGDSGDHPHNGSHSGMGQPEPTYADQVEGWCPDHGFWYWDQGGELATETRLEITAMYQTGVTRG
jgi:hypothetical protein